MKRGMLRVVIDLGWIFSREVVVYESEHFSHIVKIKVDSISNNSVATVDLWIANLLMCTVMMLKTYRQAAMLINDECQVPMEQQHHVVDVRGILLSYLFYKKMESVRKIPSTTTTRQKIALSSNHVFLYLKYNINLTCSPPVRVDVNA